MRHLAACITGLLCLPLLGTNKASFEQNLEWTKNSINSYAQMRYQNPPNVEASTAWAVTEGTGCRIDLKESFHRESRGNLTTAQGVLSVFEDSDKTYTFDLSDLKPSEMRSVTAEATPYIILSTTTDMFQIHAEHKTRVVRAGGEERSNNAWTEDERARSLWIYFGSGKTDNTKLVKEMERTMRASIQHCRSARAKQTAE